jgi:hypothetical protein
VSKYKHRQAGGEQKTNTHSRGHGAFGAAANLSCIEALQGRPNNCLFLPGFVRTFVVT